MGRVERTAGLTLADRLAAEEAAEWLADKRLLKWSRRQVNADLRKWRQAARDGNPDADALVSDCKAKLRLLNWADSWSRVRDPDYPNVSDERIRAELQSDFVLVMASVRFLAQSWRDREGWRSEWER
jgi:hypothetical protein